MTLTPAVRDFLDQLEALLDAKDWSELDRERVQVTEGRDMSSVVLPHRSDPGRSLELHVEDRPSAGEAVARRVSPAAFTVVVNYGAEHQHFTDQAEALRFLEMLGDGRVHLVVTRHLAWNSIKSYRDDESLPFARTSEPWLNLRPRTEMLEFGFRA
jgi:hypothetical protein